MAFCSLSPALSRAQSVSSRSALSYCCGTCSVAWQEEYSKGRRAAGSRLVPSSVMGAFTRQNSRQRTDLIPFISEEQHNKKGISVCMWAFVLFSATILELCELIQQGGSELWSEVGQQEEARTQGIKRPGSWSPRTGWGKNVGGSKGKTVVPA